MPPKLSSGTVLETKQSKLTLTRAKITQHQAPAKPSTMKVGTVKASEVKASKMKELAGPKGKEPTRYGDWEKNGRCIDF